MKKMLMVVMLLGLVACTSDNDVKSATYGIGLTDVVSTGYRLWGCGEDDSFHTGFSGKNVQGQTVTGVVCSGMFKGATVRFDAVRYD